MDGSWHGVRLEGQQLYKVDKFKYLALAMQKNRGIVEDIHIVE